MALARALSALGALFALARALLSRRADTRRKGDRRQFYFEIYFTAARRSLRSVTWGAILRVVCMRCRQRPFVPRRVFALKSRISDPVATIIN